MRISTTIVLIALLHVGTVVQASRRAPEPAAPVVTEFPPSNAEVSTAFVFPEHLQDKRFIIGQPVEVLVGLRNHATRALTVSSVTGSLNHLMDNRNYLQNFTERYNVVVAAGSESTLTYTLSVDPHMEATSVQCCITVFYDDHEVQKTFSTTFFNSTVKLLVPPPDIDSKSVFTWVGAISALGIVGLIVRKNLPAQLAQGKRGANKQSPKKAS